MAPSSPPRDRASFNLWKTRLRESSPRPEVSQAGTWDPCLSACTWANVSSSNKIQREEMITDSKQPCAAGANYEQKALRRPENSRPNSSVGSKSRVWCMPPAPNTTKGVGRAPKLPLQLTPGPALPSLHVRNQPTPRRLSEGTCLFSPPPAAAGAPVKPGLNFSSGLRSVPVDWGGPGTRFVVAGGPKCTRLCP